MKMKMVVECRGCGKQHNEVEVEMMAMSMGTEEDYSPIVVECECGYNTCLELTVKREATIATRKVFDNDEAYNEYRESDEVPQWYRDRYR